MGFVSRVQMNRGNHDLVDSATQPQKNLCFLRYLCILRFCLLRYLQDSGFMQQPAFGEAFEGDCVGVGDFGMAMQNEV